MFTDKHELSAVIPKSLKGLRLDNALVQIFPEYSRARLQKWIRNGEILVNGKILRPRDLVLGGEKINLQVVLSEEIQLEPEDIQLNIIFEDRSILVINKPAGMVVHPGAGNPSGTLANALLYYLPSLSTIPRAGIVHRLDKDTTGILVIAKNLQSHSYLVDQLQRRKVSRKYLALVQAELISGGTVDAAIARHPVDRKRMAVVAGGKPAITHYKVKRRFSGCTLLDVQLETGRTHQIRVHLSHINLPIVGDPVYGQKISSSNQNKILLSKFPRQALHAEVLSLKHPETKNICEWCAPLPDEFKEILMSLEEFKDTS